MHIVPSTYLYNYICSTNFLNQYSLDFNNFQSIPIQSSTQDRYSKTSIYQKIENLLILILMKTSIYSKMIEILKHCIYENDRNIETLYLPK